MSVQDGVERFLDDVDPVILSRGQDYYRRGYVESIDHNEGHVIAEVSGSEDEPCPVDLTFLSPEPPRFFSKGPRCAKAPCPAVP